MHSRTILITSSGLPGGPIRGFVRRQIYGDYLEWIVQEARASLSEPWRFSHILGDVDAIEFESHCGRLRIGIAQPYLADRIVLA